jgi:toxin ParE1/3/4
MARCDLTEQAAGDLKDIARYTKREWGTEQARRYREELALSLQKLSISPNIGRARDELGPGVRSFKMGSHIAFYTEQRGHITVLRILHPSRDIDGAFQRDIQQQRER